MSHCPNCTLPIEPMSRFCGVCGTRLEGTSDCSDLSKTLIEEHPPALYLQSRAGEMGLTGTAETDDRARAQLATPSAQVGDTWLAGAPLAMPSEPLTSPVEPIGQILNNRFLVERKLGEGGFGAVYKGIQKGTNRAVAIKLLHPEMTRDRILVERFRLEGQVLCRLKDAHTVTTYDFDITSDGTLFIAMELLEGLSLHAICAEEAPIHWRRMLKMISQMCSSLAEAHQMGIVHRDLKPENVHLEKRPGNDEFVKILDFGIAKMLGGGGMTLDGPQLTATGQTLGTLEYMSPEQLMGKLLDGRSDIYAMGVMAHELMTGEYPFPNAISPALLITAQLKTAPPLVSSVQPNSEVPAGVDALVTKMLAKTPGERFSDVNEVREECHRLLQNSVGSAERIDDSARVRSDIVVGASQTAEPWSESSALAPEFIVGCDTKAMIATTTRRSPWGWVVVGGIIVLLGVTALALWP